jgi:hypothetical protein
MASSDPILIRIGTYDTELLIPELFEIFAQIFSAVAPALHGL